MIAGYMLNSEIAGGAYPTSLNNVNKLSIDTLREWVKES